MKGYQQFDLMTPWLLGVEGNGLWSGKRHKGAFAGDGNVLNLDCTGCHKSIINSSKLIKMFT